MLSLYSENPPDTMLAKNIEPSAGATADIHHGFRSHSYR